MKPTQHKIHLRPSREFLSVLSKLGIPIDDAVWYHSKAKQGGVSEGSDIRRVEKIMADVVARMREHRGNNLAVAAM